LEAAQRQTFASAERRAGKPARLEPLNDCGPFLLAPSHSSPAISTHRIPLARRQAPGNPAPANSYARRGSKRRTPILDRLRAIGKYGSLAVIERYIRSLKNECTRLLPIVPLAQAAFGRELDHYVGWHNAERPHSRFGARTPDEIYFGSFPACRRPRHEPRACWPRRSPCAQPHALVRGRPGAVLELIVEHRGGRKHLPVVSLRRVA
jgi:hypothetical protein